MSRHLSAVVSFLTSEEGGRTIATGNGVRSLLRVQDEKTSCRVFSTDSELEYFEAGVEYEVVIELLLVDSASKVEKCKPLELFEGNRVVGVGRFI